MTKKKEWKPNLLVWPWTLDKFTGTPGDKRSVLENLANRNFPVSLLKEKRVDERVVKATGRLLCQMLDAYDSQLLPWMLVMSNSIPLLQAISILMPITYSLTTMGSCAITNTSQLMDIFHAKRSFNIDFSEEALHEIQVSGFLCWEGINSTMSGTTQQGGRFSNLLEYRMRNSLLTLFTAPYIDWKEPETIKHILTKVEQNFGSSVSSMLMQTKMTVNLKTDLQLPECVTLVV